MSGGVWGVTLTHEPAEEVDLRWLGPPGDPVDQARRSGASGLVVDATGMTGDEVSDVVQQLAPTGLNLHISGLRDIDNRGVSVASLDDQTLLHVTPSGFSWRQRTVKRTVDLVGGMLLLVLISSILLVAAVAVRAPDRGPALSRQKRTGVDGKPLDLYELRPRKMGASRRPADEVDDTRQQARAATTADPAFTPIGRFLQSSGIDELCNVFEGTRSLVGPDRHLRPRPPRSTSR
jgi:lipopolysaccharide/colanic/teichoic acid biosynthesis glycosyltransferase